MLRGWVAIAGAGILVATAVSAARASIAEVTPVPAGSEILFASGMAGGKDLWGFPARELWVAKADGAGTTQITHAGFSHNHFAMSPDRKWIFTNRYSRGDTTGDGKIDYRDFKELWLIDLVNHTEKKILEGVDGGYGGVAWAPDSRSVYYGARTERSADIFQWWIDGSRAPVIVTNNLNPLLGMPGEKRWMSDIDVSPDGQWLVMLYSNGDRETTPNRKVRVVIMKLDGTEARFVSDGGKLPPGQYGMWPAGDFDPDFSPDGKAVSFMRATDAAMLKRNVSSADIMRQNIDGTGLFNLSEPGNRNQNGISSWGGPRCEVIFAVWSDAEPPRLEVVRPDGTNRRKVRFKGDASHVQWIPVDDEAGRCK
jgi:Tol biopolymer transport system component